MSVGEGRVPTIHPCTTPRSDAPISRDRLAASVRYTIWHMDTGNLIGDFATESAAMAAVREELHANLAPDGLVLQRERAGAEPEFVASGTTLADLALGDGSRPVGPARTGT